MIKTAGELISEAQTQIDCIDAISAKSLYQNSVNAVIIDVREVNNYDESSLQDSINRLPPKNQSLNEMYDPPGVKNQFN